MLSDFQGDWQLRRGGSCWAAKEKLQASKETAGKRKGNQTPKACHKQPGRYGYQLCQLSVSNSERGT